MKKKIKSIIIISVAALLTVLCTTLGVLYVLERSEMMNAVATNTSWYDENEEEFVITTAEELYGLVKLSDKYDFKGQTIKLGADIIVNEGSASEWDKKTPENRWSPITGFAGTFDGQGHSISGLYAKGSNANLGLFAETKPSCEIKNFKIRNSYFQANGNFPIGSVSANGSGKFSQIYSDAIMVSDGEYAGGLFGLLNAGGGSASLGQTSKVSNCWFDGEVRLTSRDSRHGGGIAGGINGGTADILHCLNTGSISNKNEKIRGSRIGGIVGGVAYANNSGVLRVEDCLNVGTVKSASDSYVGSVIGGIADNSVKVSLKDVYATVESAARTIGYTSQGVTGGVRILSTEQVKGKDWYSWTTLDFDKQWTVTETDTPMLQCFAAEIISVDGLKKTYDISWYNELESSFVLNTKEELIGLSILASENTFEGKTIRLGADIVVNEGKSEDWLKKTPAYIWSPIGNGITAETAFCGNFDGQGHTISGLFTRTAEMGVGLFRCIGTTTTVRNLKITNSHFEYIGDYGALAYLGTIAGRSCGNLDTIYSDATLVSTGQNNGGMLGQIITSGLCTINNCWYDGDLRMLGKENSNTGGIMGGGMVGRIESGQTTISHCLMSGNVSSETDLTGIHIGGFVGYIRYTRANEGVKLNISDSLMSGTVHANYISCVGMIVGRVFTDVTATFKNVYAVSGNAIVEDNDTITYVDTVSRIDDGGAVKGGCLKKSKEQLSGYNGYIWTVLDFDKYWSVVTAGNGQKASTPILKAFAENSPSLAGKTRMIDTKWYDASKTTYTISNIRQLYGLSELAGGTTNFEGKTIKLGADIKVNRGNAEDWKKNAPAYEWLPIGAEANETQGFCGIFDGQGHTISGLYTKTNATGVGLFRAAGPDSVVKNLRLTNSYFEYVSEKRSTAAAGSIVGRGYGDVDTVYSDAIIRSGGIGNGGMVGQMYGDDDTRINNCWYNGLIEMVGTDNDDGGQHAGGMVGRIEWGAVSVTHCLFSGKMTCEADKAAVHMGGMVGYIRWKKLNDGSNLLIKDCLVSGTTQIAWNSCAGAVLGRVCADMSATIEKTYAVENSLVVKTADGKTSYGKLVGYEEGKLYGGAIEKTKEQLTGNNGYIFTELDFKNYWAVTADGAPVLKSFGGSAPSAALTRMVDTSWYKEGQKSYIIKTAAQLYGFADIVRGIDNFAGTTVKLGADIVVNQGKVNEWEENQFQGLKKWEPIGTASYAFRGNFDGQGHTISGLYLNGNGTQAMFARAYGDNITLKNFSLKETYIKSTGGSNGSVAAIFHGNMEHIYSEADIVVEGEKDNVRYNTGGMAGWLNGFDTRFSHCWFAGSITCNGQAVGGICGVQYYTHTVTMDHCLVTATLETTTSLASQILGGFMGSLHGNWTGKDLAPKLILKNSVFEGTLSTKAANANMTGLTVGQISTSNPDGGLWIEDSYFAPTNNKYVIGWQADKATVTHDGGKTKFTGSCIDLNNILRKDVAEITVLNKKLGFKDSIWCDTIEGIALKEFVGDRELIDISWYDKDEKNYTLKTRAQLFGLSRLNELEGNVFEGKTIRLGNDITLNEGTVAEWEDNGFEGLVRWQPLGIAHTFNGDFDGQGNTIFGLYLKGDGNQALFANAYGNGNDIINIGNFDLKNTYIRSAGAYNGSVAGKFSGNLTSVYSDAKIIVDVSTNHSFWFNTGGLVGAMGDQDTTIANCWYGGKLTSNGSCVGGLLGYYGTNAELTIENCLVSDSLTIKMPTDGGKNRNASVGGFIGKVYSENAKAVNIKNSIWNGNIVKKSGENYTHIGLFMGQVFAVNCSINASKAYYPADSTMTAIGWTDGNKITVNGATYTTGKYTANAQANNTLKVAGAKLTDDSTVASLSLDGNTWKDSETDGLVLLLNGNEKGLIRINLMWYKQNQDTYTLKTKEDLYGFAYLGNHRSTAIFDNKTVKLGQDITVNDDEAANWATEVPAIKWIPINSFIGTLDGQGHKVSGLYMNESGTNMGFFRTVVRGTVKDFRLTNTYIYSGSTVNSFNNIGSIAGVFCGTMQNVYTDAILDVKKPSSNNKAAGGFAGCISGVNGTASGVVVTTISGCQFDGIINTTSGYVGGVSGWNNNAYNQINIENSKITGTIDCSVNSSVGGFIGEIGAATITLNIKDSMFEGNINFASGTKTNCGLLVGASQTVDFTDSYAVALEGFNDVLGKLKSGTVKVNGVATTYTGTCAQLDTLLASMELFDINWYTKDKNSNAFTISNQKELYGFAMVSNTRADRFANKMIKLGDNITLSNGSVWTPVEDFKGTFDGQGHTISGLSVSGASNLGMFATITGGTVQNLGLKNSTITATGGTAGSIVGTLNAGMIKRVYSDATVTNAGTMSGGIAGRVNGNSTFEECQFAGTIAANGGYGGGISGWTSSAVTINITNCHITGTITAPAEKSAVAGFFGAASNNNNSPKLNISNSIFDGTLTLGANCTACGLFVGEINTPAATGGVWLTNSYGVPTGTFKDLIGVQKSSATVTDDNGTTKYTGTCEGLDNRYTMSKVTVSGCQLSDSIWENTNDGVVLKGLVKYAQ